MHKTGSDELVLVAPAQHWKRMLGPEFKDIWLGGDEIM